MSEFKYEIIKELGVISERKGGWSKQLNLISWNDAEPKDKKSSLVTHRQEKEARLRTFLVWTNRRASVYAESYGLMVC